MTSAPTPPSPLSVNRTRSLAAAGLAVLGLYGAAQLGWLGDVSELAAMPGRYADTPWALPVAVLVFCAGAFLAIPQFALIAAAVLAFGPVTGFAWSWLAILCSGTLTFFAGRWVGEGAFERYAGERLKKLSGLIGRNTFIASVIVRSLPAGPFLFVNMAFGLSGARWLPYITGLALGVIPKTALIAFAGQGIVSAVTGSPLIGVAIAGVAIVLWLAFGLLARRVLVTNRQNLPK
ncbi:MAG: VTT domain-containing protein [Pseudomonadota bacterium]